MVEINIVETNIYYTNFSAQSDFIQGLTSRYPVMSYEK